MAMQIEYRDSDWLIEGERVWWDEIGDARMGWRCSCWERVLPERGAHPNCRHTQYVAQCEFHRVPIEESGPKIVALGARKP